MTEPLQSKRIEGLDFARALAMFGMLIVNFKIIMGAAGRGPDWLLWFTGLFDGRASATFVTLAGIGVALMTRKARISGELSTIKENKMKLWKRSAFLFILGLLLYVADWTGDILHYYGVYMLMASFLIVASTKLMIILSSLFLITSQALQVTMNYLKGWHPEQPFMEYLDFWTIEGFLRNLLFNGYHPLFPWLCFFLLGMILGRLDIMKKAVGNKMFFISIILLITIEVLSKLLMRLSLSVLDVKSGEFLFQTGPIPPNILYILSNSASSIIVIVASVYIVERFAGQWLIKSLIQTGQLTLTHYVSHVFIGVGILALFNRLENQTLAFSLVFTILFFVASIFFSVLWSKKYKRGPIEWVMRKMTD
ncbi:heparan-alpha-glucosaminide N-acetyltransferase domain-containing protein [Lysinibacillus sp. M3]|uniref:Heparan-alpha-glucosaminide N-acetyltransferase domain-containing protein n=1 Tax=Lysinibacillus zambalensis TaxID=3160866 RepID=A0ABV1MNI1_9BACI